MPSYSEQTCALIVEECIPSAWRAMLELFGRNRPVNRTQSSRGVSFDVNDLTVEVQHPLNSASVEDYHFPQLVDDYLDRLFGATKHKSLIAERLFRWRSGNEEIDQCGRIINLLRSRPETRSAVFSLWRPELDHESAFPMSPVSGCFRVWDERLYLSIVARSMDVWVGAVPEMIAFARFQGEIASELAIESGPLVIHIWSAHIYEEDLILARREGSIP